MQSHLASNVNSEATTLCPFKHPFIYSFDPTQALKNLLILIFHKIVLDYEAHEMVN